MIVFGAGTVGLLVAAMAKLSGATVVLIADIDRGRVQYAIDNGFATKGHIVALPRKLNDTAEEFAAAKELASLAVATACADDNHSEGADITFDCTGKEICMQAGLYVSFHRFALARNTF